MEEFGRNLHRITFQIRSVEDEQYVFLMSDVHFDSPYCDRELAIQHLDEAKRRGAVVLDAGDFFDMMQGKFDRRSDKRELRPELAGTKEGYIQECINQGAEWLEPYKDIIAVMGQGNHERAIARRHEYNVTQALVDKLRISGSRTVHMGGYGGYVVFYIKTNSSTSARSFDLYYYHGSGGGGPVTKDLISANRKAASIKADIYWQGHVHEQWEVYTRRLERTKEMKIVQKDEAHVRTPGYKNEYEDGYGGFHVETAKPPKPIGGYWLRFFMKNGHTGDIGFDLKAAR